MTLEELLASTSASILFRYDGLTVEITGDSVNFFDGANAEVASFDHSTFNDIVTAFDLARGNS